MPLEPSEFEILREKRRKDYNSWKPIYCKAVAKYVDFNASGFRHLNFKIGNKPRSIREALYKLNLLPLVRVAIQKSVKVDEYRKTVAPVGGSNKRNLKEIEYWGILGVVGKQNVRIKVILRRIGKGKIHFWSVMKVS